MKRITLLLFISILSSVLNAQRTATWQKEMDSTIKEMVLDPLTGILIVETKNQLQAVSPQDQDVLWQHTKKELSMNKMSLVDDGAGTVSLDATQMLSKNMDIELIPNTNLFLLTKGTQFLILNIETGDIQFNSVEKGIGLIDQFNFPEQNTFIALVKKGTKYQVVGFNTQTLQTLWEQPIDGSAIIEFLKTKGDEKDPAPKVDKEGNFLICFNRAIYKLDRTTGKILWKQGSRVKFFDYSPQADVVVTYNSQSLAKSFSNTMFLSFKEKGDIEVINNQTGELNFKPMEVKNFNYAEDFGSDVLIGAGNRFNRYDYQTGEKVWKKDPKGSDFSGINKTNQGTYVYTADDEIMHIDQNGEKIWKKPVKITDEKKSETLVLEETPKGNVVYITESHANIVNLKTGEKQWRKDLKLDFDDKRPTLAVYDPTSKNYFIYNDEKFYTFNEQSSERPDEFAKVKIKKEKEVNTMFNIKDILVVTGTGEIMAIDKQGHEVYHKYYKEPGGFGRKFGRFALGAGSMLSDAIGNSSYSVNGGPEQGLFVEKGSMQQGALNDVSMLTGSLGASLKNRFNASKNIDQYSYFFAREGENKVLVKVDRATGKEVDKVKFDTNQPKYEVDVLNHSIFYAKGTTLHVFE